MYVERVQKVYPQRIIDPEKLLVKKCENAAHYLLTEKCPNELN